MLKRMLMIAVLLAPATLIADTVVLKNGAKRVGTVLSENADVVRLRVDNDGIRVTIEIPLNQIERIDRDVPAAPPATKPAATQAAPATQTTKTPATAPVGKKPSRFLEELFASASGNGPDKPERLSEEQRRLLNSALNADKEGRAADAVPALIELYTSMQREMGRLDGVTRRVRSTDFGVWLATMRWQAATKNIRGGSINWGEPGLTDVEKPALIGILRMQTEPALAPLKQYMGPVAPNGAVTQPTKDQLSAIQPANALELRDKTLYAIAVLSAQVKLEPDMPAVDRNLLSSQLGVARRVLGRCNELEPQARALAEKAAREKRLAEEKAKRDAAKKP